MSSDSGSVSYWFQRLKAGDESAIERLWSRYSPRLQRIACSALGGSSRSVADEDDVITQAFSAFTRRAAGGAYGSLRTRDEMWRLLVVVTRSYAWKQARFLDRIKRGRGRTSVGDVNQVLSQIASRTLPADSKAELQETLALLLEKLGDEELRHIVIGRLHGKTSGELATELDRSVRTVERRIEVIRETWHQEMSDD